MPPLLRQPSVSATQPCKNQTRPYLPLDTSEATISTTERIAGTIFFNVKRKEIKDRQRSPQTSFLGVSIGAVTPPEAIPGYRRGLPPTAMASGHKMPTNLPTCFQQSSSLLMLSSSMSINHPLTLSALGSWSARAWRRVLNHRRYGQKMLSQSIAKCSSTQLDGLWRSFQPCQIGSILINGCSRLLEVLRLPFESNDQRLAPSQLPFTR
jgi:hypothetical protein